MALWLLALLALGAVSACASSDVAPISLKREKPIWVVPGDYPIVMNGHAEAAVR
jgi:hypothetical protein